MNNRENPESFLYEEGAYSHVESLGQSNCPLLYYSTLLYFEELEFPTISSKK